MSRTQIVLESKNNQQSSKVIDEILDSHGFEFVSKKNEDFWQQGIGVTQSPKYIRYYFDGEKVVLEGWVKNFGRESDLSGVVGSLPKRTCKKILDEITEAVERVNNDPSAGFVVSNVNTQDSSNSVESGDVNDDVNINQKASPVVESGDGDNADLRINEETLTDDLFNYLDNNRSSGANVVNEVTTTSSNNVSYASSANKQKSKGIIPRRYRGSAIYNVFEVIIGILYFVGASSGYLVLRFTDSSEALMVVAIIFIVHGGLSLISHMQDQ